jgi:hypothetical protein
MAGFTQSICHIDHAEAAKSVFEKLVANPGPVVDRRGAGGKLLWPGLRVPVHPGNRAAPPKVRDRVPMTFVTPEPYIGHLGLDGVGDTKGLLESQMREKHIKWMTNTRVKRVEDGTWSSRKWARMVRRRPEKDLPFAFSMMLPAFRGIKPVAGIEGLSNPRGFTIVDKHQRNPKYPNIFAVGVCVAIPPMGPTPVPCGVPKTGFMIESMVTATAHNIGNIVRGKARTAWAPGTPSAWPISATGASPSSPSRRSRRATSTGRPRQMGASGQGGVREILPAQAAQGPVGTLLRTPGAEGAGDRQTQRNHERIRKCRLILLFCALPGSWSFSASC